jgi:hypothetical protein
MFYKANTFNQAIDSWNVGKVTNMYLMFGIADVFNQDIGRWNVGEVTKHPRHIGYLANIPTINILVEGVCFIKHQRHISCIANIPTANVLVKRGCALQWLQTLL